MLLRRITFLLEYRGTTNQDDRRCAMALFLDVFIPICRASALGRHILRVGPPHGDYPDVREIVIARLPVPPAPSYGRDAAQYILYCDPEGLKQAKRPLKALLTPITRKLKADKRITDFFEGIYVITD